MIPEELSAPFELRSTLAGGPAGRKFSPCRPPPCSTQRTGIEPPHAEGERVSGVTGDRETFVFISVPAGVVGGVPLTRARNPWVPEAST